jgi:hypothetical protein
MTPLGWLMLILLAAILISGLDVLLGFGKVGRLADSAPVGEPAPTVSIVVAAKDEARHVEAAMGSLLAQRYPRLEIIAVDDRSTDATGAILDRLAAADARLRVVHLRELPPGWLGKNHAMSVGAQAASGSWLLFSDADVMLAPDALARAVGQAEREGLDHLAIMPELVLPGLPLKAFGLAFLCWGMAVLRPWKARDPRSWRFVGIGAFNLVRTAAYARAGGHAPIRLRPDDDVKLGKLLKRSGARSDFRFGGALVTVEWYPSLRQAVEGLMKNSFSIVEYRPLVMLAGVPFYLVGGLGPFAALALGGWAVRGLAALAILLQLAVLLRGPREAGTPRRAALLYPLMSLLFAWIILRALVLNLSQGGIVWRGTFYPLSELRKNRV